MNDEVTVPRDGEQYGPCIVCGGAALPEYGEFRCPKHTISAMVGVSD